MKIQKTDSGKSGDKIVKYSYDEETFDSVDDILTEYSAKEVVDGFSKYRTSLNKASAFQNAVNALQGPVRAAAQLIVATINGSLTVGNVETLWETINGFFKTQNVKLSDVKEELIRLSKKQRGSITLEGTGW